MRLGRSDPEGGRGATGFGRVFAVGTFFGWYGTPTRPEKEVCVTLEEFPSRREQDRGHFSGTVEGEGQSILLGVLRS